MNTFSTSLEASESRPKAVAIITARGGSKRIPHKNVRISAENPLSAIPSGLPLLPGFLMRLWFPPMRKRSLMSPENTAPVFRFFVQPRRRAIMLPPMTSSGKCFWPMKAAGSISNVFAAFTPPLPLLRPKN